MNYPNPKGVIIMRSQDLIAEAVGECSRMKEFGWNYSGACEDANFRAEYEIRRVVVPSMNKVLLGGKLGCLENTLPKIQDYPLNKLADLLPEKLQS